MSNCPYCGHDVIEGADHCDGCGHSLTDLSLPTPATEVERSLISDRIAVLDPKKPWVVGPRATLAEAMQALIDHAIGCLLVVDDGQLVGIFSERDVLTKISVDAAKLSNHPVSEFMTPAPQSLSAKAKIAFAVQRMDQGGYRHVPIVDDAGQPVGVISVRDILRYITEKMSQLPS